MRPGAPFEGAGHQAGRTAADRATAHDREPAVRAAVLASGLLDVRVSLTIAVSLVAIALAATALLGAGWQVRARPARGRAHPASR